MAEDRSLLVTYCGSIFPKEGTEWEKTTDPSKVSCERCVTNSTGEWVKSVIIVGGHVAVNATASTIARRLSDIARALQGTAGHALFPPELRKPLAATHLKLTEALKRTLEQPEQPSIIPEQAPTGKQ